MPRKCKHVPSRTEPRFKKSKIGHTKTKFMHFLALINQKNSRSKCHVIAYRKQIRADKRPNYQYLASGSSLLTCVLSFYYCTNKCLSGVVISMLSSHPRVLGFKSLVGQRHLGLTSFHVITLVHLAEDRYRMST